MIKRLCASCWLMMLTLPLVTQASWQIVVHRDASIESLSVAEVKYLFLEGQVQGQVWELIDLSEEPLRAHFYESVLSMTLNRWRANWAKRVFTGNHRIPKQLSLDSVLRHVETNPGAVAYVPDTMPLPDTLKTLYCSPKDVQPMGQLNCTDAQKKLKKAAMR